MRRIYVVVEGQSEESFITNVLAESLAPRGISLTARLIGKGRHKGGRPIYARLKPDVISQLKQDRNAYCSTMLDFYGLGQDFPGKPLPSNLSSLEKGERIEKAVKEDISRQLLDAELRFIPYVQLHEYEGLLFSDPGGFARAIKKLELATQFQKVRDEFPTPEDINERPDTAPSKRVRQIYRPYQKVIEGTLAAREVGIDAMRRECPHFRNWLERLEAV
ncbi:MAG TPA: DUF4276 family protein [Bryobacteraceae bacterium]|nr:DUF4276 family protein [Bryobacteraceae bacterium]